MRSGLNLTEGASHHVKWEIFKRNLTPFNGISRAVWCDALPETQKNPLKSGFFVSAEGLEPSTNGLKGRCSAIELRAHNCEGGFYHHPRAASITGLKIIKIPFDRWGGYPYNS